MKHLLVICFIASKMLNVVNADREKFFARILQ